MRCTQHGTRETAAPDAAAVDAPAAAVANVGVKAADAAGSSPAPCRQHVYVVRDYMLYRYPDMHRVSTPCELGMSLNGELELLYGACLR
jgi:hypothetical protein